MPLFDLYFSWNVNSNSIDCVNALKGHERSVDCIAADPSKSLLVSGSYDTHLKIWDANLQLPSNRVRQNTRLSINTLKSLQSSVTSNIFFRIMMMMLNPNENVQSHLKIQVGAQL